MDQETKQYKFATLKLVFFCIVFLAILIGLVKLFDYIESAKSIIIISVYFLLLFISLFFKKNRLLNIIGLVIYFPLGAIGLLLTVIIPFYGLFLHGMLLMIFSFLPFLIVKIAVQKLYGINIPVAVELYSLFLSSTILLLLFHKQLSFLAKRLNAITFNNHRAESSISIFHLIDKVFTISNIRFFIYTVSFLFLAVYGFKVVLDSDYYLITSTEKAMIPTFATFVAFDRLYANSPKAQLSSNEILQMLSTSIKINATETEYKEKGSLDANSIEPK